MTTITLATVTYASVVSRESVRIVLTIAGLNNMEVQTADIKNTYLTAPVGKKTWCKLGPEFGSDAGKQAIVVRALWAQIRRCSLQGPFSRLCAAPWLGVL